MRERSRSAAAAFAALALVALALGPLQPAGADSLICTGETPSVADPDPVVHAPVRLLMDDPVVRLPWGVRRTVPATLRIPADATPLDVFFLVDTTSSMDMAICGMQKAMFEIAAALGQTYSDVHFGLGQYKTFNDMIYRRERAIGPLDQDFVDTLYRLRTSGGGDETQLAAIYEAATGEGEFGPDVFTLGKDAEFRPGALPIILHVADETFTTPEQYPGRLPTYEEVGRALRERHILQVGISVSGGAASGLRRVARESGALVPSGGVDCDADGRVDLVAGEPLVCAANGLYAPVDLSTIDEGLDLGPTIIGLVEAVRDVTRVQVVSGDERIVPEARVRHARVNLRRGGARDVDLTVDCRRHAGDHRVRLRAKIRDATVARQTLTVRCGRPPALAAAPTVAAPPAPGAEAPATQPATQPQVQSQPGTQPVAGLAAADQQQPQAALAHALDERPRTELAFSDRAAGWFVAAAAAIALAFAGAATRPQRAFARTEEHR